MKSLVNALFLLFISFSVNAQTSAWEWAIAGNSTADGNLNAMAIDNRGNLLIAGDFKQSISISNAGFNSLGGKDVFVAKIDAGGNGIWTQQIGSADDIDVGGIVSDNNNNVYVAGTFRNVMYVSTLQNMLTSKGKRDIFLVKFDKDGNVLWLKSMGGMEDDITGLGTGGNCLAIDKNDNIYITGSFQATAHFDTVTLQSKASFDVFIAKFNSNGNISWGKAAEGYGADMGTNIVLDHNDNIIVSGVFDGALQLGYAYIINDVSSASLSGNTFLAKFDNNGAVLWGRCISGHVQGSLSGGYYGGSTSFGSIKGRIICTDEEGDVYISGSYNNCSMTIGNVPLPNTGNEDGYLAKFDENGNSVWAKSIDGQPSCLIKGVAVDKNKNVYITGSIDTTALLGNIILNCVEDVFIAKADENGNFLWGETLTGDGRDLGSVVVTDGDIVYVGGNFESKSIKIGAHTVMNQVPNGNIANVFIAKFNTSLGIRDALYTDSNVSLYPNPSDGVFHIESNENFTSMKVYDAVGKLIMSKPIIGKHQQIDISKYADGVYFIELQGEKGSMTKQVVLQK